MKKNLKLPYIYKFILHLFSLDEDYDSYCGDMEEAFIKKVQHSTKIEAHKFILNQLVRSLPGLILSSIVGGSMMLKNYFKVAFRNLKLNKSYSFINIFGLAIGMASCILIILFVSDELNYDRFHKNYSNIFRANLDSRIGNNELKAAVTPAPMANALLEDFPQVIAATKFSGFGSYQLKYCDKVYTEENYYWTDSSIFEVFTFEFLNGDPKTALSSPNSIVVTEKMAKKYFGNEEPIGKILTNDNTDLLVTAVVKEFPSNSHFHFDFLSSFVGQIEENNFWFQNSFYTYFVLQEGIDPAEFETMMNKKFVEYSYPEIAQATGIPMEKNLSQGFMYQFKIQPLADIHLKSHVDYELEANSNITYVYSFLIIAIGVFLIGIVNFMNLSTAKSAKRAKEVGIRKTLGSSLKQLVNQFLSESILMSFLAFILALFIVYLTIPIFNELSHKDFSINLFFNPYVILTLGFSSIIIGVFAGSYPSFVLSSYKPVDVVNGVSKEVNKKSYLRNGLVVFQFFISVVLIAVTLIVYDQLDYMQSRNLGFNKEQIIVLDEVDNLEQNLNVFLEEIKSNSNILAVSNSNNIMGRSLSSYTFRMANQPEQAPLLIWTLFTDDELMNTYQFKLTVGRFFENERGSDSIAIILNESALKTFGIVGDPLGQQVVWIGGRFNAQKARIIGVIKDFHFESFHTEIGPLVLSLQKKDEIGRFVSIKVSGNNINETIDFIKSKWDRFSGQQPFQFSFFDKDFEKIHKNEQRTAKLFTVFSLLAIFVACLGLLGLAAFTSEQRTKEIGIRKVLGATSGSIVYWLIRDFTKWVITANLMAWPVAFILMSNWLNSFHYRIDIGITSFIISGLLSTAIAVITVSTQVLKASLNNPVDSIKCQ